MVRKIQGNYKMGRPINESKGYSNMIYQVLDGHYLSHSGKILEDTIQTEVWERVKSEFSKDITNKRKPVTSLVWGAFIDLINYYGEQEFGEAYNWKMDQKAVQRWFDKHGYDYKEVLKSVVESVEKLREERLAKKESTRSYMVKRLKEDNFDLIKDDKKDKKTLDAYTAEIGNLKKELSDCKDAKRKIFLQSTIAQYEKKAKQIKKFLDGTESVRHAKRTSVNESYSDIDNNNVWEVFDYVKEYLTPDDLVENMARWMGLDDLTKCMKHICRTQGINVLEDEEDEDWE